MNVEEMYVTGHHENMYDSALEQNLDPAIALSVCQTDVSTHLFVAASIMYKYYFFFLHFYNHMLIV
jgi:hypothetical protein